MPLYLAQDARADAFLQEVPLALILGMLLDQQIPMERAFRGPFELSQRLQVPFDAAAIADLDPVQLDAAFAAKPAIHRFPSSMAKRTADMCRAIAQDYQNSAQNVWLEATDGADLARRLGNLPGFGPDKTKIFIALLGKQLGLAIDGWREASDPFGREGTAYSVADIVDETSLMLVRQHKAEMKAMHKKAAR